MKLEEVLKKIDNMESRLNAEHALILVHMEEAHEEIEKMDLSDYLTSEVYIWNSVLHLTGVHLQTSIGYLRTVRNHLAPTLDK